MTTSTRYFGGSNELKKFLVWLPTFLAALPGCGYGQTMNTVDETVSSVVAVLKKTNAREQRILTVVAVAHPDSVYGYDIIEETGIEPGNLYPLLKGLEKKKILVSEWVDSPEGPRRRLYSIQAEVVDEVKRFVRERLSMQRVAQKPQVTNRTNSGLIAKPG
jgi:PadR family transcriptional regulator, regulatory protein PadR